LHGWLRGDGVEPGEAWISLGSVTTKYPTKNLREDFKSLVQQAIVLMDKMKGRTDSKHSSQALPSGDEAVKHGAYRVPKRQKYQF